MLVVNEEQRILDHKLEMEERDHSDRQAREQRDHELQLAKLQHKVVERNLTIRSVSYDIFTIIPKCVIAMCITILWLFRRPVDEKLVKWLVK